jgi:predicted ATPase
MAIWAIDGTGGVGKTWLALRWAHDHVRSFPDGQLHINLRGFGPSGSAVDPAEAVRAFPARPAAWSW